MNGYIKLHRKMQEWEWYSNTCTKVVFLDLLLSAAFQTTSYKGVELQAGQVATSVQKLADRLGFTPMQIRTALNNLQSSKQITRKTTNKLSVITIENWGFYQGCYGEDNKQSNKQSNKPTEEEEKNINNINNITPLTPLGADTYGWFIDSVSTELVDATRKWLRYKQERREKYKPTGLNTLLKKIQAMAKQHSDEAVISAIEDSIANGYQGVVWDRLSRYKPIEAKKTNWEEWLNDQK